MKIIFLGTNGWFDTKTGNTICTLIKTKFCNIILDAGYGIYKINHYLDVSCPTYLFLSHLHLDHIAGLHTLVKFKFKKGLKIFIPPGMLSYLKPFFAQPFTLPPVMLPFKLEIQTAPQNLYLPNLKIKALELVHSSICFGYRFETEDKVIAYCTDTGICDNALKLAKNAQVLITECALKKGQKDESWPHLNPESAASLAKKAKAKQLILTHFDAHNYKSIRERKIAQDQARKIFKKSFSAIDGMQVKL